MERSWVSVAVHQWRQEDGGGGGRWCKPTTFFGLSTGLAQWHVHAPDRNGEVGFWEPFTDSFRPGQPGQGNGIINVVDVNHDAAATLGSHCNLKSANLRLCSSATVVQLAQARDYVQRRFLESVVSFQVVWRFHVAVQNIIPELIHDSSSFLPANANANAMQMKCQN